ncbi:MAG: hypothetical protein HQK87_08665, partial [Nitrospinae bacterium]|nr:hypothetical protein [Nitrospinota bacterium]
MSARSLPLSLLLLLLLGLTVARCGSGASTRSDASGASTRFYATLAASGALAPDGTGGWTLTLDNAPAETLWFDERPLRESGTIGTAEYVGSVWPVAYKKIAPNAVLDAYRAGTEEEIGFLVSLASPAYDAATGRLTVAVTLLGTTLAEEPTDALALDDLKLTILDNAEGGGEQSWSYVAVAESARLDGAADGLYTLTLTGVGDLLYEIGNAPNRRTARSGLASFVALWDTLFDEAAPNVLMTAYADDRTVTSHVLTLSAPVHDAGAGTLVFTADLLHGEPLTGKTLSVPTLVIDQTDQIGAGNRTITIKNGSGQKVWIGGYLKVRQPKGAASLVLTDDPRTGWVMANGATTVVRVPDTIEGSRFWVRTGCVTAKRFIDVPG